MTDVANMLARSAAYALRVQHQRAVEAMVVSDALRLRRPRWIRSPDSRLMHQYLANRGALDGVVPAEVLYGKPHAVPQSLEEIRELPAHVPTQSIVEAMYAATKQLYAAGKLPHVIHAVGPEADLASLCGEFACGWYSAAHPDTGLINCALCLKRLDGVIAVPELVSCCGCYETIALGDAHAAGWRYATFHDGEPVWLCPACLRADRDPEPR